MGGRGSSSGAGGGGVKKISANDYNKIDAPEFDVSRKTDLSEARIKSSVTKQEIADLRKKHKSITVKDAVRKKELEDYVNKNKPKNIKLHGKPTDMAVQVATLEALGYTKSKVVELNKAGLNYGLQKVKVVMKRGN